MSFSLSANQEAPRGVVPSTPHDALAPRGASSSAEPTQSPTVGPFSGTSRTPSKSANAADLRDQLCQSAELNVARGDGAQRDRGESSPLLTGAAPRPDDAGHISPSVLRRSIAEGHEPLRTTPKGTHVYVDVQCQTDKPGQDRPAPPILKECRNCCRDYSRAEWETLPLIGVQTIPGDEHCFPESYAMRNCLCGSTLAMILEPAPPTDRGLCVLGCVDGVYLDTSESPWVWRRCANHAEMESR